MQNVIYGNLLADKMQLALKEELKKVQYTVRLAVVLVGENTASQIYVKNKVKACSAVGIDCKVYTFAENVSQIEVINCLQQLANDISVHGILLQLPLPKDLQVDKLLQYIPAEKDVDGFLSENIGKLALYGKNGGGFVPCTPLGILEILRQNNITCVGKHVVIVGRSNIVGKPLALLLLAEGATVSVCHSQTQNLAEFTKQADILIVAVGKSQFITADMVKQGAVVIDVGINRQKNGKICGDVHFESVQKVASAITTVPGGVGPMTITMLLYNCYQAARLLQDKRGKNA